MKKSPEEIARRLVAKGYKQISRKYRAVARLPEGRTGFEALRDASPDTAANFERQFQRQCTDYFLRCHAPWSRSKLHLELSTETFAAFRAAGGDVA